MKLRSWGIVAALLLAVGSAAGEPKVWVKASEVQEGERTVEAAETAKEAADGAEKAAETKSETAVPLPGSVVKDSETEDHTPGAAQKELQADTALSGRWSDCQIRFDGTVCQFPMMYGEWEKLGWTPKDDTALELEPRQYGLFRFGKDSRICTVYILNLGMNNEPVTDCIVAGIRIDSLDWDPAEGEVELPGGLKLGEASAEDILDCYGPPSDTYEGDLYTQYTYEEEYKVGMTLYVYRESGILEDVDVENFVEPEGYDVGEASEEIPASVAAYEKPGELSEDLASYEIELDGSCYRIPVPVGVLLSDGWEFIASETDDAIAANSSGWVGLIKGGQKFRALVLNEEDYGTVPRNCWIEELDVGGYVLELDGALPGGIRIGMAEEAFLAVLDAGGMEYELEESGDFRYYTYNENSYDQYCQVMVYAGEGSNFPRDTIVEVLCSNAFE